MSLSVLLKTYTMAQIYKEEKKEQARNQNVKTGKKDVTGAPSSADPHKIKTTLK
jgi:hypothetical protein